MDRIRISRLLLPVRIGVGARERRARQTVCAEVVLELDLAAASRSDRLGDTVDYAALADRLRASASESCRLLEALAGRLAAVCLAEPRVAAAEVTLTKVRARPGLNASVTVRRGRAPGKRRATS